MGDYSIAKSYKGILRLAHIMEYNTNFKDELLEPYYYGNPTALMDISGGNYSITQFGYPTPITGLSGSCSRYTSENPSIGEDGLKNGRVPMTDSMGNYLNWNIGLNGVTIGSNEDINGNQISTNEYGHNTIFPILESNFLKVGFINKLHGDMKYKANNCTLTIEDSVKNPAMLIIENSNYYKNSNSHIVPQPPIDADEETLKNHYNSLWKSYNTSDSQTYRTVYTSSSLPKDYDVFMYNQDNFDWNNKKNNDVRDCFVTTQNFREYIKEKINQFLNGNVVEVPTGTVIHQYCSLQKWYASDVAGDSNKFEDFPGNRPPMNLRQKQPSDQFFETLVEGACKDVNHLVSETQQQTNNQGEEKQDDTVNFYTENRYLSQIIPLYKRDYVLCDGSKYRISYRPKFKNSDITNQRQPFDRFLNLYFVLGYKYTKNLAQRTDFFVDNNGKIILKTNLMVDDNNKLDQDTDRQTNYENWNNYSIDSVIPGKKVSNYRNTSDQFADELSQWKGNYPLLIRPFSTINGNWNGLDDVDVLFGMDYASMVVCEMLYNEFKSPNRFNYVNDKFSDSLSNAQKIAKWNLELESIRKEYIENWLKNSKKFHEKYIFNTFVTDNQETVKSIFKNTFNNKNRYTSSDTKVISIPYYNYRHPKTLDLGEEAPIPMVNIGREVNSTTSWIKIYDHTDGLYKVCRVWELPNVQLFIRLLASVTHSTDDSINKFCYSYFNYDFQVPDMVSKNPVFIGSTGTSWSDPNNKKIKETQSWSSNFTETSIPHRHAVFFSPIDEFNQKKAKQTFSNKENKMGMPSGSCCWAGSVTDNSNRTDGKGNYIVNDLICEWKGNDEVANVNGFAIKILDIAPPAIQQGCMCDYDIVATGSYRKNWTRRDDEGKPAEADPRNYEELVNKLSPSDIQTYIDYYDYQKGWEYSFRLIDDPRFETGEPNRGITSAPISSNKLYEVIHKSEINTENYPYSNANYFSMQHISMIPLIKI